ncbi:MAG TPA: T9SS type A sorting domain-containing protein [Bacteroidia bacterium]|nr:T9SS type A sorting domain-containing protein [Bacteroidia bacterium]
MKAKRILNPITLGLIISGIAITSAFKANTPNDGNGCQVYSSNTKGFKGEGGNASSCGSPGELGTCSRPTCHGAGATPAGIADNAGPGSVALTAVPALAGNQYVPGQLYHMTVTVSQTGRKRFGFGCEILDNSGSSNGHINNTAGTVTVTDNINTRTWCAYGTGRCSITHDTNGGYSKNTASFNFDWTAPSAAYVYDSVNIYLCGNASNDDLKADSGDYIYSKHIILTKNITAIANLQAGTFNLSAYPVPANKQLTVSFSLEEESNVTATLYSLDGKVVRELENRKIEAGNFLESYPVDYLAKGMYFLNISTRNNREVKKIIIE